MSKINETLEETALQSFFERACETVLGNIEHDNPCAYGHFDCSTVPHGRCSDETVAAEVTRLLRRGK